MSGLPMKTDHPIYQFLATGPEAFLVLTGGMTLSGPYRFSSATFKGIERRIDALFEPQGHDGPVYLIEFQAQTRPTAWYPADQARPLRGSPSSAAASGTPDLSASRPGCWSVQLGQSGRTRFAVWRLPG
jgi:hypothetical protein